MQNCLPTMAGDRFQVITYIEPATFIKIEEIRGDVSRSRFIGKMIKKCIEQ